MSNFTDYINTQIQVQMRLGYTQDPMLLTGLRNIKADYDYIHSRNPKIDEIDLLNRMYKEREDNSKEYTVGSDLYMQEITEMNILKQFIPVGPSDDDVITFLKTLSYQKSKVNFKRFQEACQEHFGQKVNSQLILGYINGDFS